VGGYTVLVTISATSAAVLVAAAAVVAAAAENVLVREWDQRVHDL